MGRNCNLELRLVSPAVSFDSADYDNKYHPMLDMLSPKEQEQQRKQQLTIFYNGSMAVCDVTELQARAIISLASGEMEVRSKTPTDASATSPLLHSPLQSPNTNLSMKRSLQRFLQKRKNRVQANSPYYRYSLC